jgi:hypothetical protein
MIYQRRRRHHKPGTAHPKPPHLSLDEIAQNFALIEHRLRDANRLDLLDHLRADQRKTR